MVSSFFRLENFKIEGYKNIGNVEIDFSDKDGITIFIGNNGCGKSNILEALSSVFAGLYQPKLHIPIFSYQIRYTILNKEIEIIFDKNCYKIKVDEDIISKVEFDKKKDEYLPKNVIACYSGEHLRLFEKFYKPCYEKYVSILRKEEKLPSLPLFYIDKNNLEIAILTLFFYDFSIYTDVSNFCHDTLNVKRINNVTFTYGKSKKILTWKENEVLRLIKLLSNFNTINVGKIESVDYEELKNRLSLYENRERELFQHLYAATMSKKERIIENINIKLELNSGDVIDLDDLSEGEKKYILLKVILETLADENSLLLFDEPDAFIHISRKAELANIFEKYKKRENVITTHSPTMAVSFSSHLVGLGTEHGKVVKIDSEKEKIIATITEKMWNVHEQNMFLASNKSISLLVEGKTDKIHLTAAYDALKTNYPDLDFDIYSFGGADNIPQFMTGLKTCEIDFSNRKIIAILDNDEEGRNSCNQTQVKYQKGKKNKYGLYAITLPSKKDATIENLYDVSKYDQAFKKVVAEKTFNGLVVDYAKEITAQAKIEMSNMAKDFNPQDFDGFKPLFDKLKEISGL